MSPLPYRSKPGMCVATGSFSRRRPCSTSVITAVVVGHHLGQRSEIEDRIKSHRLFRRHGGAEAKRFFIQRLIALADHDDGARGQFRGHGLADEIVDAETIAARLGAIGRLAGQNARQERPVPSPKPPSPGRWRSSHGR